MKITSTESLEMLFSKNKNNYFFIMHKENDYFNFFKENVPSKNLLVINCDKDILDDEEKLFKSQKIISNLKKNGIDGFWVDYRSSSLKEKLAEERGISLITTPWTMQEKFENKIFFDDFLKENKLPVPKGQTLKTKEDVEKFNIFPAIVQKPFSEGSLGTFLINNRSDLKKLILKNKLPLLARKYIKGAIPLGVTILIGKNKVIFSALRLQVYIKGKDKNPKFYGIQWIKTSFFNKKIINNINESLRIMAKALQKEKFIGAANIDLMVKGNEIFYIECNPRLAGSNPHIALKPELLHNFDFPGEFIKSIEGKALSANKDFIPNTHYEGTMLDLDYLKEKIKGKKFNGEIHKGFYEYKNGQFAYKSDLLKNFKNKNIVLFRHFLKKDKKYDPKKYIGFCFMHQPISEMKKNKLVFSKKGEKFLNDITKLILKNNK